jgi:hypothetical protein
VARLLDLVRLDRGLLLAAALDGRRLGGGEGGGERLRDRGRLAGVLDAREQVAGDRA